MITTLGCIAIAVAIMLAASVIIGLAEGKIAMKALEAVGRNPEAAEKIQRMMIIAMSIVETGSIYILVIALLLIFYFSGLKA